MGSILSIQLGASVAKGLFRSVGAEGVTALRLMVGALLLAAAFRPWRAWPRREAWPALVGYGLCMGVMNLFFYMALARIPLGVAVAVEFIGPLSVALLSSRHWRDFCWLGLAAAGLLLLSPRAPGGALDPWGLGFALAAGACWAGYILFSQKVGGDHGPQIAALGTAIGAAVIAPIGLWQAGAGLFAPALLPAALLVGALSSAIPYTLELVALIRMPAKTYGALVSVEPAVAALIGFAVLGERLSTLQWTAIVLVMVASIGAALTLRGAKLSLPD